MQNKSKEGILCISFNQDNSAFSVGTESGFRLFATSPFKELNQRGNKNIN